MPEALHGEIRQTFQEQLASVRIDPVTCMEAAERTGNFHIEQMRCDEWNIGLVKIPTESIDLQFTRE